MDIERESVTIKEIKKAIKYIKEDLEMLENFSLFAGKHSKVNDWKIAIYKTILAVLQTHQPTTSKTETVEPCEWCDDNWVYPDGHFGRYDTEEINYLKNESVALLPKLR